MAILKSLPKYDGRVIQASYFALVRNLFIDPINAIQNKSLYYFNKNNEPQYISLHGPSMFAVKAKIYGVLYKQSSSIAFDETSTYWLTPKNS